MGHQQIEGRKFIVYPCPSIILIIGSERQAALLPPIRARVVNACRIHTTSARVLL